nr:MAG TPA: hypothetical protein [Caudoviricetes sp.]
MPIPLQAVLARMVRNLIRVSARTTPIQHKLTLGAGQTL